MSFLIREIDPGSPDATMLMRALDADLASRYPGAVISGIDAGGFRAAGGIFLVGYDDGVPVACGALRRATDGSIEIKRMFVIATARRRGYARAVLAELELRARTAGAATIRLETGGGQPEAIRLYEAAGYHRIPCFGEYSGSPHSHCFEKSIARIDRIP